MSERDYEAVCPEGHRSCLRLVGVRDGDRGRCPRCGKPAELYLLPKV